MRKAPRGIFRKLSESINKLEQNLSQSTLSSSRDSQLSFNSTSEDSHFEDHHEQDDSISLRYDPNTTPESPKAILSHRQSKICCKNNH